MTLGAAAVTKCAKRGEETHHVPSEGHPGAPTAWNTAPSWRFGRALLMTCVVACGRTEPAASGTAQLTVSSLATGMALGPTPSRGDLRAVACGFGGVGPVGPPDAPNAWIVAIVDLDAAGTPLTALRVEGLVLLDANGAVAARAKGLIEAGVVPPGRASNDFSREGTKPFTGDLGAGAKVRLRLQAPLDVRLEGLWKTPPTRFRVEIVEQAGVRLRVEGAAQGPWATG